VSYFLVLQTRHDNKASQAGASMAWVVLGLALLLLWQFLTVHYLRAGNWTALFLSGEDYPSHRTWLREPTNFPATATTVKCIAT
jgi:hypothetical protein